MFVEYLKPFTDWLHLHPYWASLFVFLISFGESIAIFGLLVPGSVVMTAIGALIGAGILPLYPILIAAMIGAVLGDVFSFWLGFYLQDNVRRSWPFNRYPQVISKGEAFFERHGGKSVFLGRFVGPIRPVIPLIAGMLNMKPARFFIADIPAAVAWAPVYMLPGILLGELSLQLQPEMATKFILATFATLIVFWLIYWLLKRITVRLVASSRDFLNHIWQRYSPSYRWMQFMEVPGDLKNALQFRTLILFIFLFFLFCFFTYSVLHQGVVVSLNESVFHFMRSLRNQTSDQMMNIFTFLGVKQVMLVLSIVVCLYFIAKRNFWALTHWIALNMLCFFGIHFIKDWVQSPRPGSVFISLYYGWSFPSGHTVLITAILGFLAILTTQQCSTLVKRWCFALVTLFVVLVGISRIYLGFHWLSDVLGGILLALTIVIGVTFSYRCRKSKMVEFGTLWTVALLTLLVAWGVFAAMFLKDNLKTNVAYSPVRLIDEKAWWAESDIEEPLYRTNRFGKPVQLINVAWAGDLQEIQKDLLKAHWKIPVKPDLAMIVASFTDQQKSNENPVFLTKYYQDRKPALVMTKIKNHSLLVLRLWDSQIMLRHNGYTVWVGTVNYYRSLHSWLRHSHIERPQQSVPAIDQLKKDLHHFEWKEVTHPSLMKSKMNRDVDWTPYTLVIKPKSAKHEGE